MFFGIAAPNRACAAISRNKKGSNGIAIVSSYCSYVYEISEVIQKAQCIAFVILPLSVWSEYYEESSRPT